jgi:hypothetical protein
MEIIGNGPGVTGIASSTNSAATNSGRKIRHHNKNNPSFSPATLVGVGSVPMRLSASEVGDEEDSDEERDSQYSYHKRTGSGRSSTGSTHRRPVGLHAVNPALSMTSGTSSGKVGVPSSGGSSSPNTVELETSNLGKSAKKGDYFGNATGGSSGSSSWENSFGNVGQLAPRQAKNPLAREKSVKNPDELRRRGSVDDRTMTMSAGRLFVANPDLSDWLASLQAAYATKPKDEIYFVKAILYTISWVCPTRLIYGSTTGLIGRKYHLFDCYFHTMLAIDNSVAFVRQTGRGGVLPRFKIELVCFSPIIFASFHISVSCSGPTIVDLNVLFILDG